jgi:hypothetical protein
MVKITRKTYVERQKAVNEDRSITYVDDTAGASDQTTVLNDMSDIQTIIIKLMGPSAINVKKTIGPEEELNIIGWHCNMNSGRMQPSENGLKKIIWWLFRGVSEEKGELKISLNNLRKLVGILRWYAAVIPMASTFALQKLLTIEEKKALHLTRIKDKLINVRSEAWSEIRYWRWIIGKGLSNNNAWSAPFWFLAKSISPNKVYEMYTDASTLVGGGYYIPLSNCADGSIGHFGQFLWTDEKKSILGTIVEQSTDINILEFVTVVLAILSEKKILKGCTVRVRVDNTTAISWLNKLKSKHINGQMWMTLLLDSTILEYNIILIFDHVAGDVNIIADGLSRYYQVHRDNLERQGYKHS